MANDVEEYEKLAKEVQDLKVRKKASESQLEMLMADRQKLEERCIKEFGVGLDELKSKKEQLDAEFSQKVAKLKEILGK